MCDGKGGDGVDEGSNDVPPAAEPPPATLLPPCLVARRCSAAAKAGRTVLQLDPSDHYGGSWASLHLDELQRLLLPPPTDEQCGDVGVPDGGQLAQRQLQDLAAAGISGAEVWQQQQRQRHPGGGGAAAAAAAAAALLGDGGQYCLDLAPKVSCCWPDWRAGALRQPWTPNAPLSSINQRSAQLHCTAALLLPAPPPLWATTTTTAAAGAGGVWRGPADPAAAGQRGAPLP